MPRTKTLDELNADLKIRGIALKKKRSREWKRRVKAQGIERLRKRNNSDYHLKRWQDFKYYLDTTDLTLTQIARGVGVGYDWLARTNQGIIMKPGEHRVTTIIDFLKDYERLTTYYAAVIK